MGSWQMVTVNNESWLVQTVSVTSGTRVAEFRDTCRQRDQGCVITGEEAAHILPLVYESHWIQHNYGHWIGIHLNTGGSINSVQNGMLLEESVHTLFDNYVISINPDVRMLLSFLEFQWLVSKQDNMVVCFRWDRKGIAGKH